MATRKQHETPKYQQWTIIPPPATRIFQLQDGSMGLYFEKVRAWEMVVWAQELVNTFETLASMAEAQGFEQVEEEEPTVVQKPIPPVVKQGVPPGLPIGMHKTPPNSIGTVNRSQAELLSGLSVQKKNPMAVQRQQAKGQEEAHQSTSDAAKIKFFAMRQGDAKKFNMKDDPGFKIAAAQAEMLARASGKPLPKKESEPPPTEASPESPRPTDDLPKMGLDSTDHGSIATPTTEGTEPSIDLDDKVASLDLDDDSDNEP